MDQENTQQPQQNIPQQPPPQQAAPQPQPQPTQPSAAPVQKEACKCPEVKAEDWDKKRTQLNKMFYKTFSPKLFYFPFSIAVDINRAIQGAKKAGYTVPDNAMILDTGGMFMGSVMVEVQGAKEGDKNVVSFAGKNLYTKVCTRPWKEMRADIMDLERELGAKPKEFYMWYTACPKCIDTKNVKTVLIAVV
ncbi:MAG: hydrolase [Candidatus Peregrinibacteria bacterium]